MDNLQRDYNLSEISILTFPSKHFCIAAPRTMSYDKLSYTNHEAVNISPTRYSVAGEAGVLSPLAEMLELTGNQVSCNQMKSEQVTQTLLMLLNKKVRMFS